MRDCGVSDPSAIIPRFASGFDALLVAWAVTGNDTLEFRPIDFTNLVVPGFFVPFEVGVRYGEAEQFCLAPFREGKWLWTAAHGKATNLYCKLLPAP